MKIGETFVVVRADTSRFASEAAAGAGTAGDQASESFASKFAGGAQRLGSTMTKFVSLPLAAGLGFATKAASDLTEQMNKSEVVFGAASDSVAKFAEGAAKNLGLSKRAAFEALGTFGNLFTAMNIGQQPAADMSKKLVQLASDLASFNNANPEEVLEALRSGLIGEAEPLRKFGVQLSEARIQAKALELGLWDGVAPLDAGAKAQAAYAIILEDTATAQGDFARTSDSVANKTRIAKAEAEDAAASLGENLLPITQRVIGAFTTLVEWFGKMPEGAQNIALIGAAAGIAAGPILNFTGNAIEAGVAIGKLNTAMGGGLLAASGWGFVIGAVAIAVGGLAYALTRSSGAAEESAEKIQFFKDALSPNDVTPFVLTIDDVRTALEKAGDAGPEAANLMNQLGFTMEDLTAAVNLGDKGMSAFVERVLQAGRNANLSKSEMAALEEGMGAFGARMEIAKTQTDAFASTEERLMFASQTFGGSIAQVNAALAEGVTPLQKNGDVTWNLERSLVAARLAMGETYREQLNLTGSADVAAGSIAGMTQSLADTTFQIFGGNLPATINYISALTGIPADKFTNVTNTAGIAAIIADAYRTGHLDPLTGTWTSTADLNTAPALQALGNLEARFNEVFGRIQSKAGAFGNPAAAAGGGMLELNRPTFVGEDGPELLMKRPGGGVEVLSNPQTRSYLEERAASPGAVAAMAQGNTYIVNVYARTADFTPRDVERTFDRMEVLSGR